jgi:hypothetical protein
MKTSNLIFACLTILFMAKGQAATLNQEQLDRKAIKAVGDFLPAESYPNKCLLRYEVSSKSSTRTSTTYQRPDKAELEEILAGVKTMEDLKAVTAAVEAKRRNGNNKTVTQQLTATVIYREGGITKTQVLFDVPDEAESAMVLNSNMTTVLARFVDRACMAKQSHLAPQESKPSAIQLSHKAQPPGAS